MYGQVLAPLLAQELVLRKPIPFSHVIHRLSHVEIVEIIKVLPRAERPLPCGTVVAVITATPSQSVAMGKCVPTKPAMIVSSIFVQRSPEFATVGAPYPIEIVITAQKECADVTVHQTLPYDSEFHQK